MGNYYQASSGPPQQPLTPKQPPPSKIGGSRVMWPSQDHPQQLQSRQPQREQSHSGQDGGNFAPATAAEPSRAVSSWGVTYLLQSAKRGWQRHRSPHVVSLDAANKCLEVSDAATSRLQERVVLTAACADEEVHVAFVAAAGGQNIIRFTLAGQPERKFALIADNGRGATELCEALDREGVTVQGMEDLPDAVFLRGHGSQTAQALDTAIPSLSRPEVQAYVVRLLFQDSFRQFVGDLSEMFAHVQAPLPAPILATTTASASPAREDGGRGSSLGGRHPDGTVRFGERGGGGRASGISGGGGDGSGGTRVYDNGSGGDLQGSDGAVGGCEISLAGEGAESNSVAIGGGEEQGGEGAAVCSGGTSAVGAGDSSGRRGAGGKGKGRAQRAGSGAGRGAQGGKTGEPGRKAGKRRRGGGGGGGGAWAETAPCGGVGGGSSGGGGGSGNGTVEGRERTNPGLRSVPLAAPEHRKRSAPTAASPAGLAAAPRTKIATDVADAPTASDATGRGARPPSKRTSTHDKRGRRKENAGDDGAGLSGSALLARRAGPDAVALAAAAAGGQRRQGTSAGPPLPVRAATSSGRAPGLCATLTKIWSKVNKHPASWAFLTPVDLAKAPGYLDVVKHPIDLESIRSRLDGPTVHYTTGEMLHDDLVLMCRNAMLYNEEGDVYHRAAVKLLPFIESIFAQ